MSTKETILKMIVGRKGRSDFKKNKLAFISVL